MSTPNPELLSLKVNGLGTWQPGQRVKTPGTRFAWNCLAGWIQVWQTLQRRRVSSTRYQQESNHIQTLPLEMIAEDTSPDALYDFLEIMAFNSGNRPRIGEREGHPTTEMVAVANNRLVQIGALPFHKHRRREGLRRALRSTAPSRSELMRRRRAKVAAPHLSLF